jgi:ribosomal protein S18 acetylase RimI-like enzyme
VRPRSRDEAEVTSLAVLPAWRGQGFARSLLFGACEQLALRTLEAEVDAEGVDVAHALGFAVESLGQRYPGVERFRCRLELPPR